MLKFMFHESANLELNNQKAKYVINRLSRWLLKKNTMKMLIKNVKSRKTIKFEQKNFS